MLACVGLGHQQFDVASDQLFRHIAEEPLSRLIDRSDRTVPVDYDDSIDRGIDDRAVERVGETFATLVLQPRRRRTQLPDPSNASLKGPYKATTSPNLPLALQVSQMSRAAEPPTERRHRSQKTFDLVRLDRFACCRYELDDIVAIADEDTGYRDGRAAVGRRGMKLLLAALIMHLPAHRLTQPRLQRSGTDLDQGVVLQSRTHFILRKQGQRRTLRSSIGGANRSGAA
jgi:hypothetical protein